MDEQPRRAYRFPPGRTRASAAALAVSLVAAVASVRGAGTIPRLDPVGDGSYRLELVAQAGGASHAVVADSGIAYLGVGPRVVVLDVRAPGDPVRIAESPVLPGVVRALAFDRDYLLAAVSTDGLVRVRSALAVLSVADPSRPTLLSVLPSQNAYADIAVLGDTAVLVGWPWTKAMPTNGVLDVVDVRDRGAPRLVATRQLTDLGVAVSAEGRTAYVLTGSGKLAFDRGMVAPAPVGSAASARVIAFDLADAAAPRPVAVRFLPVRPMDVAVVGGRIVVAGEERGLWILGDVAADLALLETVLPRPSGWCASKLAPTDQGLVMADLCAARLRRIALPPGGRPTEVGSTVVPNAVTDVWSDGTEALAAIGLAGGVQRFEVSPPTRIGLAGTYEVAGALESIVERSGAVIGAHRRTGMVVERLAGASAQLVDEIDMPGISALAVSDGVLYATEREPPVLHVLDVPADDRPVLVASAPLTGHLLALAPGNGVLYVAAGYMGVGALDITDPHAPRVIGYERSTAAFGVVGLALAGDLVHAASGVAWVRTVDVSDPARMTNIAMVEGRGEGLVAVGRRLYRAGEQSLSNVDYTVAAAPRELAKAWLPDGATTRGLGLLPDHLVMVGGQGVMIVRIEPDGGFTTVTTWPCFGESRDVVVMGSPDGRVAGSRLYVADGDGGLVLLQVVDGRAPTTAPTAPPPLAPTRAPTSAPAVTATPVLAVSAFLPAAFRSSSIGRKLHLEFAGQLAGGGLGIDAVDDRAYRGEGPHLVILDISAAAGAIHEVARSDPLPGPVVGVDVVGDTAFVAANDAGLVAIDLSDESRPRYVGRSDASGSARDVGVVDQTAFVAVADLGLVAFDVGDPTRMREIGRLELEGGASWLLAGNGYVLVAARPLRVVDVRDPAAPAVMAEIPETSYLAPGQAAISGSTLYVLVGSRIEIFDVGDPSLPRLVGSLASPSTDRCRIWADGEGMFVQDTKKLTVYDVSEPTSPVAVGSVAFDCEPNDAALTAGKIVVSCAAIDYDRPLAIGQVSVVDVSQMSAPRLAAEYWLGTMPFSAAEDSLVAVDAVGEYLYARVTVRRQRQDDDSVRFGFTSTARTALIDPRDPSRMRVADVLAAPGDLTDFATRDGIGWATTVSGTLESYDVSDPTAPRPLGALTVGSQRHRVVFAGTNVYVLGFESPWRHSPDRHVLYVVDGSDPARPRLVGQRELPAGCSDMAAGPGRLYVLRTGTRPGFLIADVTDGARPSIVREAVLPAAGLPAAGAIAVRGNTLWVGALHTALSYDLTDPDAPRQLAAADTLPVRSVRRIVPAGNELYVSGRGGLAVFDSSDPERPVLVHFLVSMADEYRSRRVVAHVGPVLEDRLYVMVSPDESWGALQAFRIVRR